MYCVCVCSVMSDSLRLHELFTSLLGSSCPWNFSRQEYWSGLSFHFPGDLPNPEIKPVSPALAGGFFTTELPGSAICFMHSISGVCMSTPISQFVPPLASLLGVHVCFLYLYAYFCFANKIIYTIFLKSTYIYINM